MAGRVLHGRMISYLNAEGRFAEVAAARGLRVSAVSDDATWDDTLVVDTSMEARRWAGTVGTIVVYSNESRFAIDLPRASVIEGSRVFNYGIHLGDFSDVWNIYANYGSPGVIEPRWAGRKPACMFATNKDSLRDMCPQDLTGARWKLAWSGVERGMLEVFGRGWKDLPTQGEHRFGQEGRDHSTVKREISAEYCVQIALENTYLRDYITEKFWQASDAGCLPIYMGSSWLDKIADPGLYIDLRAHSDSDAVWDAVERAVRVPAESEERVRELQRITRERRAEARSAAAYARWTDQLLDILQALEDEDELALSEWNRWMQPDGHAAYVLPQRQPDGDEEHDETSSE